MNSKLLVRSKKTIYKIFKDYEGCLIQKCANFKNFTGRDIDCLYFKKKTIFQYSNTITLNREEKTLEA